MCDALERGAALCHEAEGADFDCCAGVTRVDGVFAEARDEEVWGSGVVLFVVWFGGEVFVMWSV